MSVEVTIKSGKKGASTAVTDGQLKKTKKPSTLKKKILQERYRLFQEKKESEIARKEQLQATSNSTSAVEKRRIYPIFVFGLTEGIDLTDADELQEMVNNIKELFSDFSDICSIRIHRTPDDSLICEEYASFVILAFQEESSAENAVAIMNGRIIGGDRLLVVKPTFDDPSTATPASAQSSDQQDIEALLILKNVFTMDEIVEGDEDNLQETCQDILSLCQPYDGATSVHYWPNPTQLDTNTNQRLSSLLSDNNVCRDILSMATFRTSLVEHWRQTFQRAKPTPAPATSPATDTTTTVVKSKPTRTPPALLRQQKALRQFNKPLVHITFHADAGLPRRCLHHTAWTEHVSSSWYALYAASLLHELQIGGEVLRTYALLHASSSMASKVLLPLFEGTSPSKATAAAVDRDLWADVCHWSLHIHSTQPSLKNLFEGTEWTNEESSTMETTWSEDTASVRCRSTSFVALWQRWQDALRLAAPLPSAVMTIYLHAPSLSTPALLYRATASPVVEDTTTAVDTASSTQWDVALCVENYLTADDLTGDHDEICATKQDLLQIWKDQAGTKADAAVAEVDYAQLMRHIRRIAIVAPIATAKKPRAGSRIQLDDDGEQEVDDEDAGVAEAEDTDTAAAQEAVGTLPSQPTNGCAPVATTTACSECLVYVPYHRHEGAIAAMCYFDGLLLGGVPVTACCITVPPRDDALWTITVDETAAVERQASHLEALEASRQRLNTWIHAVFPSLESDHSPVALAQVFREDVDVATAEPETLPPATTADDDDGDLPSSQKSGKKGKKAAKKNTATPPTTTANTATEGDGGEGDGDGPGGSASSTAAMASTLRPRKISLYRIARDVPKLETRSSESIAHHIPIATAEINTYTKQLLQQLASYQRKLHTKLMTEVPPFPVFPPTSSQMASAKARKQQAMALQEFADGQRRKFKAKIRFVCGLRQVTQGVKAGRVKMVLLAPNTEASVALDSKVLYLIRCATALNIPVMYALSRRLLGSALEMTIKQSCVGICSAEGAGYDLFRKMLDFVQREAVAMSTAARAAVEASSSSSTVSPSGASAVVMT